ncbi:MAG: GNAT family N-acetyltransferase [Anaerolineaceae bacterium]|nr:GNAT family N-acetyltransferase [Anaerolineaceae bacterium]
MIRDAQAADAAGIARIHVDAWRTTYRGLMPDEVLAGLNDASRTDFWRSVLTDHAGQSVVVVAEEPAGELVGFASGGAERNSTNGFDGELYAIYLSASAQRKGIGTQLAMGLIQRLTQRGFRSMLVWVLQDNHPARRFYEALGGSLVAERDITIGDAMLKEVSYGWRDIQSLLESP